MLDCLKIDLVLDLAKTPCFGLGMILYCLNSERDEERGALEHLLFMCLAREEASIPSVCGLVSHPRIESVCVLQEMRERV